MAFDWLAREGETIFVFEISFGDPFLTFILLFTYVGCPVFVPSQGEWLEFEVVGGS